MLDESLLDAFFDPVGDTDTDSDSEEEEDEEEKAQLAQAAPQQKRDGTPAHTTGSAADEEGTARAEADAAAPTAAVAAAAATAARRDDMRQRARARVQAKAQVRAERLAVDKQAGAAPGAAAATAATAVEVRMSIYSMLLPLDMLSHVRGDAKSLSMIDVCCDAEGRKPASNGRTSAVTGRGGSTREGS
jgi:hypothetical protein